VGDVEVQILGQRMMIKANDQDPRHVERLASYVKRKVDEVSAHGPISSSRRPPGLTRRGSIPSPCSRRRRSALVPADSTATRWETAGGAVEVEKPLIVGRFYFLKM